MGVNKIILILGNGGGGLRSEKVIIRTGVCIIL